MVLGSVLWSSGLFLPACPWPDVSSLFWYKLCLSFTFLGLVLAMWCWGCFWETVWAAEQHWIFLPPCLWCGEKKTFPGEQWLIQLTCAHWLGVNGNLNHALHHDLKKSSLPELGGQYRLCNVPPIGPTTHLSPQPDGKSLDFRRRGWCKAALPQVYWWFRW